MILLIDTSTAYGAVAFANDHQILAKQENFQQQMHASFIHEAIQNLMVDFQFTPQQIEAIAVANGPGSYTGLRVGLTTAKGLCFAWNKPLVTLNTLEVMANWAIQTTNAAQGIYISAIDARRNEVFWAAYKHNMQALIAPSAVELREGLLNAYHAENLYLIGDGATKMHSFFNSKNIQVIANQHQIEGMLTLAFKMISENQWADLAYVEPYYLKAVHTTTPRNKG